MTDPQDQEAANQSFESSKGGAAVDPVLELLNRLHQVKDASYKDAWRKRGEVLGIFSNLARKYDRLIIALEEESPSLTESLSDTLADLCVYAGKYLTWLAEMQPLVFESMPPHTPSSECSAGMGVDALTHVLDGLRLWEISTNVSPPVDFEHAWARIQDSFVELEAGLKAQADPMSDKCAQIGWTQKVDLAWRLCDASLWMLVILTETDPSVLSSMRADIGALEGRVES